jgi:hypothetical protein
MRSPLHWPWRHVGRRARWPLADLVTAAIVLGALLVTVVLLLWHYWLA